MTDAPPSTGPGGYRLDEDAMLAGMEAIGRAGATSFQFGHLEDDVPIAKARWWANARYRGARIQVDEHVGPVEAIEALVVRILHGAMCKGCMKLIGINDDPIPIPATLIDGTPVDETQVRRRGVCRWERTGKHWARGCGDDAPEGSTREKLARAMAEAGCAAAGIKQARSGYYDDYLSPLPFPIATLVADLQQNGHHELAERAKNGDFDGTREESDAWAASEEGQATFAELLGGAGPAGGKATAVQETATQTNGRRPWRANRRKAKKKDKR